MQTYQAYYLTKVTNAIILDDKIGNIKVCIMEPIDFFKLQAKNLHRDFKTQTSKIGNGRKFYRYSPKYFDVEAIILDFNVKENVFTLMNAHHIISKLAGFNKWNDLLNATETELKLAKLLFENMHKVSIQEWEHYIAYGESSNNATFDPETKLEIFTELWLPSDELETLHTDYRLTVKDNPVSQVDVPTMSNNMKNEKITELPLSGSTRKEFIQAANGAFERVFNSIEPENPGRTRELWNAAGYIDDELLRPEMLPIDKDYALSLIDAFLVHHVIQLASIADDEASNGE